MHASDADPALEPLPSVEQYMRLRASGHHVLPEDEQALMAALVQRAHEVTAHRIGAEPLHAMRDDEDSDAEDAGVDDGDADDVFVTMHEDTKDTVPASMTAAADAAGGVSAGWGELRPSADAAAAAAAAAVGGEGAEERAFAAARLPPVAKLPAEEGFQEMEEITQWHPRRRELSAEQRRQEGLFLQLSAQANTMLGLPADLADATHGMPSFLLDTEDGSTATGTAGTTGAAGTPAAAPEPWGAGDGERQRPHRRRTGRDAWPPREAQRMLRLGVVGIPNAGKSTLTNALVGGTVTAVSVRPETTRQPVLGCFTEGNSQVAIYDTPGMRGTRDYEPRSQAMRVGATWQHVQECDLLALIVDAQAFSRRSRRKGAADGAEDSGRGGGRGRGRGRGGRGAADAARDFRQQTIEIAEALGAKRGPQGFGRTWTPLPTVLVVNKADTLADKPQELLAVVRRLRHACEFRRVFFTCAESTAAVAPLRAHLLSAAPAAEWEFEPAAPSELTWPQLAAELVREKLYWSHNHEVPYRLRPVCRRFALAPDGTAVVLVDIPVASLRLKSRVQGDKSERVERLQQRVGAELAHMMKRRVAVTVRVKVKPNFHVPAMEL